MSIQDPEGLPQHGYKGFCLGIIQKVDEHHFKRAMRHNYFPEQVFGTSFFKGAET